MSEGTVTLSVRIKPKLYESLKREAYNKDTTIKAICEEALASHLEHKPAIGSQPCKSESL